MSDHSVWRLGLADETATAELARHLSALLGGGDLVTLSGDLGAGKTTFARALIRLFVGDPDLEVPSPTFTLMQIYEGGPFRIVHADLLRVQDADELGELGWEEAAEGALVLVEWPERAGPHLAEDRLDIHFDLAPGGMRIATLTASGRFVPRMARARATHALLERAGWLPAVRAHIQGDASTRSYERLYMGDRTAVLMNSPPRADGPPIRNGKPYSAIARLAETVHAFVAVDRGLASLDLSVPAIYAADLDAGLLLIEDFGDEPVVADGQPIAERYAAAVEVLARIHAQKLPHVLPVGDGREHVIPAYDQEALGIETELLLDWYAPHIAAAALPAMARREFQRLWAQALAPVIGAPSTWTLRDFHSPNLIWLAGRSGLARVGIIDFQDAVLGHPAYDVVSLLQDARITVPEDLELKLLGLYVRLRQAAAPAFDPAVFLAAYATLGAQRNTKIAGIFARLDKRDGKPGYLKHLPRIERYLARCLSHPVLSDLKLWYEVHMPRLFAA